MDDLPLNIPIPLRDGLYVIISGLPNDLTHAEAEKIARIVKSFVLEGGPHAPVTAGREG